MTPITKEELAQILFAAFQENNDDGDQYVAALDAREAILDGYFKLDNVAEYVLMRLQSR